MTRSAGCSPSIRDGLIAILGSQRFELANSTNSPSLELTTYLTRFVRRCGRTNVEISTLAPILQQIIFDTISQSQKAERCVTSRFRLLCQEPLAGVHYGRRRVNWIARRLALDWLSVGQRMVAPTPAQSVLDELILVEVKFFRRVRNRRGSGPLT